MERGESEASSENPLSGASEDSIYSEMFIDSEASTFLELSLHISENDLLFKENLSSPRSQIIQDASSSEKSENELVTNVEENLKNDPGNCQTEEEEQTLFHQILDSSSDSTSTAASDAWISIGSSPSCSSHTDSDPLRLRPNSHLTEEELEKKAHLARLDKLRKHLDYIQRTDWMHPSIDRLLGTPQIPAKKIKNKIQFP